MTYGHFDDAARAYVITEPLTPRPWINYLGNRRLTAFISQNAGGLLWYLEPQTRRITRYHYIPAPADRPGFYVYIRDRRTGQVWNPHYAPTCTPLDRFECRHAPGVTSFASGKDGAAVEVTYAIPPDDDVMLWQVTVRNTSVGDVDLEAVSYLEFGLLEFMREIIGWCYLKNQIGFRYDAATRSIRYDYQVFEAPYLPRMALGCSADVSGFDCSRDLFIGRSGSLQFPESLRPGAGLRNSELPMGGGHGCGTLGVDVRLGPGESKTFCYAFCYAGSWEEIDELLATYADSDRAARAIEKVHRFWNERLETLQTRTGDAAVDRFVNTWTPYNSAITLELARSISTDHMGFDGLRYRDTTQDAVGVANVDPEFAADRMRLVFGQQTQSGGGCMTFYPHNPNPTTYAPQRSDNTVWQIYTMKNLVAETGDLSLLSETIPFSDGGEGTVYDHILLGLKYISDRRGPRGLPTLFDVDWNDNLVLFGDREAESVMLGMQLVYACGEMREIAERLDRDADAAWCRAVEIELTECLNMDAVWDGAWYRRLLLSNGKSLGSARCREGRIYLNPQSWAVISGVGVREGRGARAMQAAFDELDTPFGLRVLAPPYTGIPEPEDPPIGSRPGTGENGGIFCHANTWAIIAEALLGNGERAFKYYRQLLPEAVIERVGADHYQREPYVYVSTIIGPPSDRFGEGGIGWLTGTTNWMYVAATHYLLGIRPTLDGLVLRPCLPKAIAHVQVMRRFRGCVYNIEIDNAGRADLRVELNGQPLDSATLPVEKGDTFEVKCCC